MKKFSLKKLYDWVLDLAEKPLGAFYLVLLAFAESSFFPIPPDVLLMPLCLGSRKKCFRFALYCSIGSILGGIVGYGIGHYLWWSAGGFSGIANFFFEYIPGFNHHKFATIKELYDSYNFWIVFTAGFTPIPYKIITITAGSFNINFFMFLLASTVGRSLRFFLVAGLLSFYGENVKSFIDKYFNWLALLFTALLFGGFLVLKIL